MTETITIRITFDPARVREEASLNLPDEPEFGQRAEDIIRDALFDEIVSAFDYQNVPALVKLDGVQYHRTGKSR